MSHTPTAKTDFVSPNAVPATVEVDGASIPVSCVSINTRGASLHGALLTRQGDVFGLKIALDNGTEVDAVAEVARVTDTVDVVFQQLDQKSLFNLYGYVSSGQAA